ncbi:glycoside hydrolase family 15 protein [Microaerobacter geothermalis]|uniref:glycoside hydrolase family 15 protein n=1 Tax=Microaerobacter geothermalis TaxID=674972 RepID=UPI001F1B603D|nr:glycoside hydrolase family 15 protein [Microaerobacter geothermalis]MCF6092786.1 glycoside hydrolase family 15 protein [Microaerobacter geothermalis]
MKKRNHYYGLVGNGETAALIHPDLSIEWMCIPRFDGFPIFARALDKEKGGFFSLQFHQDIQLIDQQYIGRTNVLMTTIQAASYKVTCRDYMPWGHNCLVRNIEIEQMEIGDGEPFSFQINWAGTRSDIHHSREKTHNNYIYFETDEGFLLLLQDKKPAYVTISLGYGKTLEEALNGARYGLTTTADDEVTFWNKWISQAVPPLFNSPEWEEMYYRSLLVLKCMCYEKSGAIIAAPTSSFPAIPYGGDNWDYRYLWLRDGYYTALAFDMAGFHQESRKFYEFAFQLQEEDGSWRQPLYTIDGGNPVERISSELKGPNGETPIRFGNQAANQLQLDNCGNIVHGVWVHYIYTKDTQFLLQYWDQIDKACQWIMNHWNLEENGIWEIRERKDHWIHGKVMCYACLHSGSEIANLLGHYDRSAEWMKEAEMIREDILLRGWNEERAAFFQSYSKDAPLDISVLALSFYGIVDPSDERMIKTVARMESPHRLPDVRIKEYSTASPFSNLPFDSVGGLNMWGGIARYDYAKVPFYLPTLWLARYYLQAGNRERAAQLIQICIDCSTELNLMAEHFDPRTKYQWGNFPQTFSHEEMVRILLEFHNNVLHERND